MLVLGEEVVVSSTPVFRAGQEGLRTWESAPALATFVLEQGLVAAGATARGERETAPRCILSNEW